MSGNFLFCFESGKIYLDHPKACLLSGEEFGKNQIVFADKCTGEGCEECDRYIRFYHRVHELEKQGVSYGAAIKRAKIERTMAG